MMNSKLISYITSDFQSQSDIKIGQIEWEKIMNERFDKLTNKSRALSNSPFSNKITPLFI